MKRSFLACIVGFIVGLILFAIGIYVFTGITFSAWHENPGPTTFKTLENSLFLFNSVLVPLVVFVASLTGAVIAKRNNVISGVVAAVPFLVVFLILNSFDGRSLLIALAYFVFAVFAGFLASLRVLRRSTDSQS